MKGFMNRGNKKASPSKDGKTEDSENLKKDASAEEQHDDGGDDSEAEEKAKASSTRSTDKVEETPEEAAAKLQNVTKVSDRLTGSVNVEFKLDKNRNRSPDLVPLTNEFEAMRKGLRALIKSTQKFIDVQKQMDTSRMEFVKDLTHLSADSPVQSLIQDADAKDSLTATYQQGSKQAQSKAEKFTKSVLDYVAEWERIISTRVDGELKQAKKLRDSYQHYQKKVEQLRNKTNTMEGKGQVVSDSLKEKRERNEAKLKDAAAEYELYASKLCLLITQITAQGWRDLCPLVKAVCMWEGDRGFQEQKTYTQLKSVLDRLDKIVKENKPFSESGAPEQPAD